MAPFQAGSPTGDTAAAGSPSGDTAGGATEAGSPSGDTALQVVLPGILQFAPSQTGSPTGDTVAAGSPSGDTAGGFSIKPASIIVDPRFIFSGVQPAFCKNLAGTRLHVEVLTVPWS